MSLWVLPACLNFLCLEIFLIKPDKKNATNQRCKVLWGGPSTETLENTSKITSGLWNSIIIQEISPNTRESWIFHLWSQPGTMHQNKTKANVPLNTCQWGCVEKCGSLKALKSNHEAGIVHIIYRNANKTP